MTVFTLNSTIQCFLLRCLLSSTKQNKERRQKREEHKKNLTNWAYIHMRRPSIGVFIAWKDHMVIKRLFLLIINEIQHLIQFVWWAKKKTLLFFDWVCVWIDCLWYVWSSLMIELPNFCRSILLLESEIPASFLEYLWMFW